MSPTFAHIPIIIVTDEAHNVALPDNGAVNGIMAAAPHHNQQDDTIHGVPQIIMTLISQVVLFRDLLIRVGQASDSPELRENIRKVRRSCSEISKLIYQDALSPMRILELGDMLSEDLTLMMLNNLIQLFVRELNKCFRLVQTNSMDMSGFYENRSGPSNLGNVISQILLCTQITPDFNKEELCSIQKDKEDMLNLLNSIAELMPNGGIQEQNLGRN